MQCQLLLKVLHQFPEIFTKTNMTKDERKEEPFNHNVHFLATILIISTHHLNSSSQLIISIQNHDTYGMKLTVPEFKAPVAFFVIFVCNLMNI